jgi:spore coat protein CotH
MRTPRRALAVVAAALALATGLTAAVTAQAQEPETQQTSPVWDSSTVHDIQFTVDPEEYTAMVQEYIDTGEKNWLEADVIIDGQSFPQSGVKLKGQSSLFGITPDTAPTTLPWIIRLDKYVDQNLDGYERFAIRSNYTESSLNEALSLRLLEEAGLATTKSFFSSFSVNGETAELRLIVQEPDKIFDRENFPGPDGEEDGGTLYKKEWDVDFSYLGDDPAAYDGAWEPKGGDEDNWEPLLDFVDWMNNATDEEFAAELESRIDTEVFARYLAVEDLILNWDDINGPGQNGYFRWTPSTGQMTIVPWDHNLSFGVFPSPGWPGSAEAEAMGEMNPASDIEAAQRTTWGCPCVERALEVPEFRELYEQTFEQLKIELYDSGFAQTALDELSAPLADSDLITADSLERDRAQIQGVFTQDIPPRTENPGGPWDPWDPDQPPTDQEPACTAEVAVVNEWDSGWQAEVRITAGEGDIDGWTLNWTWPSGQAISSHWNAEVTTSGAAVTATDQGWNARIAAGQTVEAWGFVGSGQAVAPAVTCTAA